MFDLFFIFIIFANTFVATKIKLRKLLYSYMGCTLNKYFPIYLVKICKTFYSQKCICYN